MKESLQSHHIPLLLSGHSQDFQRFHFLFPHDKIHIARTGVSQNSKQEKHRADGCHTDSAVFQIPRLTDDHIRLAGQSNQLRIYPVLCLKFPVYPVYLFSDCLFCASFLFPGNINIHFQNSLVKLLRKRLKSLFRHHYPTDVFLFPEQIKIRQICFQQVRTFHNRQF